MGLMQRFSSIFKAKASKTLDKYEDPRETLDYSYERTLEMLQKMRRAVADVATSRKRIELQAQQLQRSAEKLEGQAKQAVERNSMMLQQKIAERTKLLSQLEQAKMQETVAKSLESMSSLAAPGNTPSLDEVRDNYELRARVPSVDINTINFATGSPRSVAAARARSMRSRPRRRAWR